MKYAASWCRCRPSCLPGDSTVTAIESPVPTIGAATIPAVSARTMAEVDRRAIEVYGISLLQMMEQAGSHLAEVVRLELGGDLHDRLVVVAAGPGNNGGGGLAAARHLANRGARVDVVLARPVLRMSEADRHQIATLVAMDTTCCVATYDLPDAGIDDLLGRADIVIDAILGYSISGPPLGEVERLIASVVRAQRPVVSLDLPSGIDPDSGAATGVAISAIATLALALPKPGLVRGDGAVRSGRLYLADLGLPDALYTGLGLDVGSPFAGGRIVLLDRSA